MNSFESELGIHLKETFKGSLDSLSNSTFTSRISKSIENTELNLDYNNLKDQAQRSLANDLIGKSIFKLLKVCPGGMPVFFTCHDISDDTVTHWQKEDMYSSRSMWQHIDQIKTICVECRDNDGKSVQIAEYASSYAK